MGFIDNFLSSVPGTTAHKHRTATLRLAAEFVQTVKKKKDVLIELNQQTESLTKKDIAKWRNAWQAAINYEQPNRLALLDVYGDAMVDLHLTGCISQRKGKTLQKPFMLTGKSGKEDDKARKMFEREWFMNFIDLALDSPYFGHSLIQFGDIINENGIMSFSGVELVPRKHVVPEYGVLTREAGDDWKNGIPYRDGDIANWCIEVGKPRDLGLLLKCAPQSLSKKNMLAYWDTFGEVFGMPIRIGKTISQDTKDINRIEKMLAEMGAASWGLFPDGTDIEIKESSRGDAYNVYDKRIDRCNSEISKGVLGQTMTIDSGSSLSQSETHLEVFENICRADAMLIKYLVNDRLIPLMIRHGFPLAGVTFDWDEAASYTPAEQREIERLLIQYYDIDPKYFADKYKVAITGVKQPSAKSFFRVGADDKGKSDSPQKEPIRNAKGYYNALGEALGGLYQSEIITLAAGDNEPKFAYDRDVFEQAAKWISECGGFTPDMLAEHPAIAVMNETFRILGGAVSDSIAEEVPEELVGALENNAFIFSGLKTFHSLNEVGLSLVDDKGGIKPFETFRKDVAKINEKYNKNYLYAEYNHAVTSSQMAAKWHDFEQDGDRYNLQYRTANDERVRAEHQALHNITLPPSDPFWSQFLPPNGWNCRCTVVQVRKNRYQTSDSAKAIEIGEEITADPKKQIFRFNPGKELKIYPDKHPYNKAPKEAKKVVAELAKERFSAKTIDEAEQQFRDKLGINCDLSGFKKKDIGQVKDIFDCVDKHFRDFPELKEKVKFVGSMSGRIKMLAEAKYKELKAIYPNYLDDAVKKAANSWARKAGYAKDCYAYSTEGTTEYNLNGLVFNTAMAGDKAAMFLQKDVASKFHPVGCDTVKSVFDHEFGHKLDALLGLRKNADFLKVYNEAVALGEQHVKENLSGYAYDKSLMKKRNYTPQAEFIAEAWSEYLNNPTPRPLAAAVGKFIENEYKKQKNRD